MKKIKYYIAFIIVSPLLIAALLSKADTRERIGFEYYSQTLDSIPQDSLRKDSLDSIGKIPYAPSKQPTYKAPDRFGDPFSNRTSKSPLVLQDPASLKLDVEIDTNLNYTIYEKIGDINFRPTTAMSFNEFNKYHTDQLIKDYWKNRSLGLDGESAVSGRRLIPKLPISPALDRIFGGSYVDIQPNGLVNLDIGGRWQRSEDPSIPIRRQRTGNLNFNQQINMNVVGKIGEKLAVTASFDNNNTFDFQNDLKVEYTGFEEDIIKKIEIGNVGLSVSNSLLTGAQNLFGVKTKLQFGKLFITGVASRQQSTNRELVVPLCNDGFGGGNPNSNSFNAGDNSTSQNTRQIFAPDYADNQHFFLGHFFRDNYERWIDRRPALNNGGLLIDAGRVEVYELTVDNNDTRTLRNVVALTDLGEYNLERLNNTTIGTAQADLNDPQNELISEALRRNSNRVTAVPTQNRANSLFNTIVRDESLRDFNTVSSRLREMGLVDGEDFINVRARKLSPDEYSVNPNTGFLSLRRRVSDQQMIAVSYQYAFDGNNYQVGEVTQDYQGRGENEVIFLKLIKPNNVLIENSTFDLMMKNIYDLQNGTGITDVSMQINYLDFSSGLPNPNLPEGSQTRGVNLNQLLGVDRLNQNNEEQPDGKFDDINGITLYEGKIVFPILEPFGSNLAELFADGEDELIERFVFNEVYEDTKINASRVNEKNNFVMEVSFEGGSGRGGGSGRNGQRVNNVIQLPFNVDPNSITVTIGGRILRNGTDYTISGIGTLTINDQIATSCLEVRIQFEEADLFNFQTKWFTGLRAEYVFNDNFNIGATLLKLNERPGGISRFSIGNEPLSNTKWGLDLNYSSESRFLTKVIDFLPVLSTKETSRIDFNAEFAQLIPGTSNQINGEGTSYLDDFENAVTPIVLGNFQSWNLGASPTTVDNRFFNPTVVESEAGRLTFNDRKAKIAWYTVDNTVFYARNSRFFPSNLDQTDLENIYVRPYMPIELFPGRDRFVVQTNEPLLDIAYFPSERGQNNYSQDLNPDGTLPDPAQNFGAITRANTVLTNFVQQNIEYIEFWLLDPFQDSFDAGGGNMVRNNTGGELVFNLGDVSEDVLRDDRHSFEHGLPEDNDPTGTDETPWGEVTNDSYITDFFPNNSVESRLNQDVGLDGLDNDEERAFFSNFVSSPLFGGAVQNDPSADDFQYYLGDELDSRDAGLIERYKNFNGLDQNNQAMIDANGLPASFSNTPDNEDLNQDNTLSSVENYFEYRVPIDVDNGGQFVRNRFVVDQVSVPLDDGGEANWYLFRVPINSPTRSIGNPNLQNIKYTRMYLTGWEQPVVMRMAKFQMVGSQWVRVNTPLNAPGFNEIPDPSVTDFEITVVNVEENGQAVGDKSPYVLPPGLNRDSDNTTTNQRRQNEQSIQLCIDDLQDRDSRGIFKQVSFDLVSYGTVRMFFHAEPFQGEPINDGDVRGFLRLGNSENQNYYEIELPLSVTNGPFSANLDETRRIVWPEENEINLAFNELFSLKSLRNRMGADPNTPFVRPSENGRYNLTIVGDPKLSIIRTMVIGVRNPGSDGVNEDDGLSKSVCIWANELRVSDFDDTKGWAGRARLNAKLADFATVSASTSFQGIGFGGIQDNIIQRTRKETFDYSLSANVNADKLLPGKHGIKVPVSVNFQKSRAVPRFDPTDPDVPLEAALQNFESPQEEEEFRSIVEDRQTVKSINFSNIRKEKVKEDAVSHLYDIENFSFNYSYTETKRSGLVEADYLDQVYNGGVAYNYDIGDLTIEPFKESKKLSNPYLQLVKDLNFNPVPNSFSFRSDLSRNFRRIRYRDIDYTPLDSAQFQKTFYFDRVYNVRWNIFKSLNLDYSARTNAIIDEGEGEVTDAVRTEIWESIKDFGRTRLFDQRVTANYTLPLDKFPITNWINANVQYGASYNWTSGANLQREDFGNVIRNNRNRSLASDFDLVKLYNKVKLFKEINTPARKTRTNRPTVATNKPDSVKTPAANKGLKSFLRLLMSVRNIKLNYAVTEATTLPGFSQTPFLLGLDDDFAAPGYGFILGSQDPDIRFRAAANGWLARGNLQDSIPVTNPFIQTKSEDLNLKATLEPIKDLKIQLEASRNVTDNFQEIFRYDFIDTVFSSFTPSRSGSFNITFNSISSAFENTNEGNQFGSKAFDQFVENIDVFRRRLNGERTDGQAFEDSVLTQDILIPAFLAAYGGKDNGTARTSPLPKIPLPNWRLDFAGLSKIPALKKIFSSINVKHGYRSIYAVNNYVSNLSFNNVSLSLDNNIIDYPTAQFDDESERLLPVFVINQISLSEQFVPLIGIDLRTKSKLSFKVDYKKDRNLSLNLSNSQVTETKNNTLTVDFGFTKDKLRIPFKIQGRTVTLKNDLTLRVGFSLRDTKTIQRRIDDDPEPTSGSTNFQLRPTLNYKYNEKLDLTAYFERTINNQRVGTVPERRTSAFGFQVRFSLAQ